MINIINIIGRLINNIFLLLLEILVSPLSLILFIIYVALQRAIKIYNELYLIHGRSKSIKRMKKVL